MNPRRLIPYVVIFVLLAGAYAGLRWHQSRKVEKEEQAKQVYQLKADEIGELTLLRGKEEIRLVKKDKDWDLVKPLAARADQAQVTTLLETLAELHQERHLGPEANLAAFGLDKPALTLFFAAKGAAHKLVIGAQAPGESGGFYALKDQDPNLFLISAGNKGTLDLTLLALRDKTLLTFKPEEVKTLKIRTGKTAVQLERTGLQAWRWAGRPDFKVRGERVESVLRELEAAKISDFLAQPPGDLKAAGLAPQAQTEVTLVTGKGPESLLLGAQKGEGFYARKGAAGAVVLVNRDLGQEIAQAVSTLEDRRLFTGALSEVHKVVWGPPAKLWTAVKEDQSFKITGPEKAEVRQPAARMDMALWQLQNLEYDRILPATGPAPGTPAYKLELFDGAGKSLFLLEDLGKGGKDEVEVLSRLGDKSLGLAVARPKFQGLQDGLARLTSPPPQPPR